MPKMKAPRRASRPAGAPPNNIPAPYPRHPRIARSPPPPLSFPVTRQQPRYYRLYEHHWLARVLLYLLRGHERERGREARLPTDRNKDKKRERDCRCYAVHSALRRREDDSTYISAFVISRNGKPLHHRPIRKEGYTGLFHLSPGFSAGDICTSIRNCHHLLKKKEKKPARTSKNLRLDVGITTLRFLFYAYNREGDIRSECDKYHLAVFVLYISILIILRKRYV